MLAQGGNPGKQMGLNKGEQDGDAPGPRNHLQPPLSCSFPPTEAKPGPPSLWTLWQRPPRAGSRSFCTSPCKRSHGRDRTTEFQTSSHFPVASAPSLLLPIPQPQGLREQIPYMLVAGGRTKEVSWREVSTVKKELENMPPPTPVNYWQGKGKRGVTELQQLNPSHPPGNSICDWSQATGASLAPSTWGTGRG